MIPARYAHLVFALTLSGMMSLLVSGVSTYKAIGLVDDFAGIWMSTWLIGWSIAFPTALVAAPLVRRFVAFVTREHAPT